MTQLMRLLVGTLLAVFLVACGGGGGSAGATGGDPGTSGGGTTETPKAASFIYTLSKNQLNNSGLDSVDLTVTVLDVNNNPVKDVAVTVAVDAGVYTPESTKTDATGKSSGKITIGGNKANRNIVATIRAAGQTSTATIAVTGAAISLSPVPATPAPGQAVRVDIKVTDSTGAGVAGIPVQMSGTLGLTGTVTTDFTGAASANGVAPSGGGNYTVDASALGVQAPTRTVQVVAGGGSGVKPAVGTISSASLSIVPNTIPPNTNGSTTNKAVLRAKFLNDKNQAIPDVRVRFEIVQPGLGAGEAISSGDGMVFTDTNGEAIADYIAGTRTSPTDGVIIKACYSLVDIPPPPAECTLYVTKTLTVASQPLSITLGDNNLLQKGQGGLTYIKQFDVAVADAAGNAVTNATVSASVDLKQYGKGTYTKPAEGKDSATPAFWCANEDTNRNGALDTGEDINQNGKLEPRKADVVLSFIGSNVTGANGRMIIQVEYPQDVATWLKYTVKVTTNVGGSEGTDTKSYITDFIEGDEKNGSFLVSPYGVRKSCTDPN